MCLQLLLVIPFYAVFATIEGCLLSAVLNKVRCAGAFVQGHSASAEGLLGSDVLSPLEHRACSCLLPNIGR